jgi:hypothetical protein
MSKERFDIGVHRPVYLWAGPGTVRMNLLKFMDAPVDEAVHAEAHTEIGALRMAGEAGFNWAHLMYDWGFPPEIEQEDWDDFRRAVPIYQAAGLQVFGYVQVSNCVYAGSYRDKDWYALDPYGRRFHYYTGRYMTCPSHPEWRAHLREMVKGIIDTGAEGVYFDNPWHGCQPIHFGGAWLGPAGCYCDRCRRAFRVATSLEMPASISPKNDETSRRYLRWRAGQMTGVIASLGEYARTLRTGVVIGANDYNAVMNPSYVAYGVDLAALAQVQDVVMIEDFALPRWKSGARGGPATLVNNALTLRTARALVGHTPLSTDPYDQGIGFDPVYPARRFQQGIAEAAACGATMVVKGTEYVEDGTFTLLTAKQYASQRAAIGRMHGWLADHAALYRERQNAASVALLHPGDELWQDWDRLAAPYFAAAQALLAAGIPWRVVTGTDDLSGINVLLCLGDLPASVELPDDLHMVPVLDLPGWEPPKPSLLARNAGLRSRVGSAVGWLFQAYMRWPGVRRLGDGLGLPKLIIHSPHFVLPSPAGQQALLEALGEPRYPRVRAGIPVLAELWRKGEQWQLHLVNYAREPQEVSVHFGQQVAGCLLLPEVATGPGPSAGFSGADVGLTLDVYAVLEYTSETSRRKT